MNAKCLWMSDKKGPVQTRPTYSFNSKFEMADLDLMEIEVIETTGTLPPFSASQVPPLPTGTSNILPLVLVLGLGGLFLLWAVSR